MKFYFRRALVSLCVVFLGILVGAQALSVLDNEREHARWAVELTASLLLGVSLALIVFGVLINFPGVLKRILRKMK